MAPWVALNCLDRICSGVMWNGSGASPSCTLSGSVSWGFCIPYSTSHGAMLTASFAETSESAERDSGAERNAATGTEIRRARIGVEGTFGRNLGFMLEADFADNDVGVKDAFLVYSGIDPLEFTLGQHCSQNPTPVAQRSASKTHR